MKAHMLPRQEWPKILQNTIVNKIYVGGCGYNDHTLCFKPFLFHNKIRRVGAHAHCTTRTLCFRSKKVMTNYICIHELSHLIIGSIVKNNKLKFHHREWKDCVIKLGGSLKRNKYQKDYRWAKD